MSNPNRIVFRMGKRIYLRALAKQDAPLLTLWINDPEITQYLKAAYPMTVEDEEKYIESMRDHKGKEVSFGIVLKESDELIGVMSLHRIDHRNGLATTGSFIGRKDMWGKGIGTEAKILVLEYAFNILNLRKICSVVYDFNGRSKRCLEKCGYKEEGIRKAHIYRNGRYCDEFMMAVFRDEFLPQWDAYKKKYLAE